MKAKKILEELALLDLIERSDDRKSTLPGKARTELQTLTHFTSVKSLAKTWDNAKEDKAWQNLQKEIS